MALRQKTAFGTSVALDLLRFRAQVKVMHWTTTSYATHRALDFLNDQLSTLVDKWVEVFMGHHGRIDLGSGANLILEAHGNPTEAMVSETAKLQTYRETLDIWEDTALANIMDELLAAVSKTTYLLSLG